ncbi:MAG: uracil-DNA glycosylase [Saprospiraceae bacterium]
MSASKVEIEESWGEILSEEFEKPYFLKLRDYLKAQKGSGKVIFPPGPKIFNAFNHTPLHKVKVVILGQDPYHQPGQAMGLSFSVPAGIGVPASLKNIYKELHQDTGKIIPSNGDLTGWADQGVFLLNSMLTVEANQAGAHKAIGWQTFTDRVIQLLSEHQEHLVFLLWGNFAREKQGLIDADKHLILEAAHPSPLARGAFFGCKHFSKANEWLVAKGIEPIRW